MRVTRRSFNKLFGIATASLAVGFAAPKVPKIVECDVRTSFKLETIFSDGLVAPYQPNDLKPVIDVTVHFDDGEVIYFTAEDSKWVIEEPRYRNKGKMYGGVLLGDNATLIINLDGGRYELMGLKEVGKNVG